MIIVVLWAILILLMLIGICIVVIIVGNTKQTALMMRMMIVVMRMVAMMMIYHSFGDAQVAAIFGPYFDAESMRLNPNVNINRWMGLVSGSFPFLVGFLIAFRYFGLKYVGVIVVWNLVIRASKIIGLFCKLLCLLE